MHIKLKDLLTVALAALFCSVLVMSCDDTGRTASKKVADVIPE